MLSVCRLPFKPGILFKIIALRYHPVSIRCFSETAAGSSCSSNSLENSRHNSFMYVSCLFHASSIALPMSCLMYLLANEIRSAAA